MLVLTKIQIYNKLVGFFKFLNLKTLRELKFTIYKPRSLLAHTELSSKDILNPQQNKGFKVSPIKPLLD